MARFSDSSIVATLPQITKEEFDAIITGLNMLYTDLKEGNISKDEIGLLTDANSHKPITLAELDVLIQHINDDSKTE